MAFSKKSAGQIHVGCSFLAPTATALLTAFNGSHLARAVRCVARLECFTAGLVCHPRCDAAPPARQGREPCQRAHIHPLIRRFRRSFAVRPAKLNETASELLAAGIHLLSCPKPRVELAPLEYAGFGAFGSMR